MQDNFLLLIPTVAKGRGFIWKVRETYFLLSRVKCLLNKYYNLDFFFPLLCQKNFRSHQVIQGYIFIDS